MVQQNFLAEPHIVEVQINLRGAYRLMPQHLLYGPEVGSALEQVGGKGVWGDTLRLMPAASARSRTM